MSAPRTLILALSIAAAAAASPALAAPTVYFGEDLGAGSPANMPNSFAARDQFAAQLSGVGVEGFEGFAAGTDFFASPGTTLSFTGSGLTASLGGGDVRDAPFNARFAVDGTKYLNTSFNQRITFSSAVSAFGLFIVDAGETNNDPAVVTIGGNTLTQEQIEARPFDSVDSIFRIVTERAPGNFEVLFDGGTFPARDSSGMFVGLIDSANPYSNIILINGTSGLDIAYVDGFGYDNLMAQAATAPIPEPSSWALMALGIVGVAAARRRRH